MDDKLNYQQARRLRHTGLGKIFADQLEQTGSVGGAAKRAISLKIESKVKGMKEKIDPLNIAKFLTFGSSWAPALLGHLTGRSHEDTRYFAGRLKPIVVKSGSSKIVPLPKDGEQLVEGKNIRLRGINEQLLKIYKLLDKSNESEKRRREMEHNFDEEKADEAERRHKEFLKVLMAVTGYEGDPTAIQVQSPEQSSNMLDNILETVAALGWITKYRTVATFFSESLMPLMLGAFPMLAMWKVADWAENADINDPNGNPIAETAKKGLEFATWYNKVTGHDERIQKQFEENKDRRFREGDSWEKKSASSDADQLKQLAPIIQNYEKLYINAKESKDDKAVKQIEPALNQLYDQRDTLIQKIGGVKVAGERITGKKSSVANNKTEKTASPVSTAPVVEKPTASQESTSKQTGVAAQTTSAVENTPTSITNTTQTAVATASPPAQTQKLNAAINENVDASLTKTKADESVTVNNFATSSKQQNKPLDRLADLAVRNEEPTLLRMMMNSSRFV